jgi:hypothetical protein
MADASLRVGELVEVFGAAGRDASQFRVESLSQPVASASRGIWRVRHGDRSVVLKLVAHEDGGHPQWLAGEDVAHWYYWRREVLAYDTGLLASLPRGLRAPRCHAVIPRDDGSITLWLEDLGDASASAWGIDRYALAARQLGRTQGRYLVDVPLPAHDWLSRGWLRSYLALRDGDAELLDDATVWRTPQVAAWFPHPPTEEAKAMRRDQGRLLDVLDRMPRTLCHLDLHPANLFADPAGATVAIDWSFVGLGAIGEDVGNLVPDAVLDFHVAPERIDELYDAVADGYEAGLRDAGWVGSRDEVRLAMCATIATKYAWILPALLRAASERRERLNRRPIDEALRWWVPTIRFLHRRADEARALTAR